MTMVKDTLVETFKVEITKLEVFRWVYRFNYRVWRNGKLIEEDSYHSSHTRSKKYMEKALHHGYAVKLVLQKILD